MKNLKLDHLRYQVGNITFGQPTPHSFRHSFAVNTLRLACEKGKSPENVLPILAAYIILHLLYDSGAIAIEITDIKIDDINVNNKTVAILGKGQRYRIVQILEKTVQPVERYAKEYRNPAKLGHQDYLFINQRGEKLTRHGIYRICKKYLSKALPEKRLINLNSVHCFRHSCAVHMLTMNKPISDIKNHLGHEDIKSTMVYLKIDQSKRKEVQNKYIEHMKQVIETDDKINDLIDWENSKEVLEWLDSL